MTDPRDTATSPLDPFFAGQQIGGQFEIEQGLGHNELGTTYLARKLDNNRLMILKTLPVGGPDVDVDYDRLREEVRQVSAAPHKNLAKVYGIGRESDTAFVVMEYVEGQPLADYLDKRRQRGESLNPKGVFNIVGHICSGLKALHAHSAHGTLTARHVFVTDQGRVKILNLAYGHHIAAALHADAKGPYVDSPFIAPELRASASTRSPAADIYALGMLTAEMLSPTPIEGHGEVARQRALAIAADFGPEILAIIEAATDADPAARPASAVDFREHLKVIVDAPTLSPSAPAPDEAPDEAPAPPNAVEIGPEPGQEALPDDAPTPTPAETEDPFAKAAKLLGKTGSMAAISVSEEDKAGARYLVSIDGLDYGPFSHEQVLEQLRADQIDEFTSVLDRATQTRMALQAMPVFAEAVRKYIPVRAERQRIENERRAQRVQTAKTAGKWTSYAGIGAGLLLGAVFAVYWFFIRPKPEPLPEQTLIADLSESFKLLPPPKDFDQINVDKDMMAALFAENSAGVRKNVGGGRRKPGGKTPKGGGAVPDDDDLTNSVDFDSAGGGTDHILTDGEVTRVVLSKFGGLQGCLMPELKRNPGFRGVRVKFFIKPSGTTAGVSILESAYNSGPVGDCLKSRFRGMQFPAHGGFNKGVIFPLLIQ